MDILGSGVLGLTIKCARCHSHKYDPIPQRDYYRLLAVFKGGYDEHDWLMPQLDLHDGKAIAAQDSALCQTWGNSRATDPGAAGKRYNQRQARQRNQII